MDAAEAALAAADSLIGYEQQQGDIGKEALARWQKIVTLKNYSLTEQQAVEAKIQMEWFRKQYRWSGFVNTNSGTAIIVPGNSGPMPSVH